MKRMKLSLFILLSLFTVSACSNENTAEKEEEIPAKETAANEKNNEAEEASEEISPEESQLAFIESLAEVESGTGSSDIPQEEEQAVIAALNQHIEAFNNKDLDAYMNTLSKHAIGFDYEQEREYMKKEFETLEVETTIKEAIIDEYQHDESGHFAAVYTLTSMKLPHPETGTMVEKEVSNYNIFQKDPEGWKMSSSAPLRPEGMTE
ncbi:YybH family protein [Metabacillus arenae]|uniref:Nuclear transport factor 2 family protein n=1 Tax=Metabacillus arenae TaxID=2771434 RepID=A0A926NK87_9BACI|nr:nuclear transport factor 2 family protein [Metabacillus arenae]MBD1379602.1 hypothetical protein [Metabacillus arenae]